MFFSSKLKKLSTLDFSLPPPFTHINTDFYSQRNQQYFGCVFVVAFKETWYWDGSNVTNMVMSGVKCTGDELALSQCQQHRTLTCQKTAARFAAGVICSESK